MSRSARTALVIAVATIMASIATYGVYLAVSRIPVREVEVASRKIVVAVGTLPTGTQLQDKDLMLSAEDETKLRNMNDILQGKLVKRGISLKALDYQKIEPAAGGTVRQLVKVQQGIPIEKAKEVVRFIKDSKAKVQASIQGETVRVSGKDRDTLQDVMAKLKANDFGIDMTFDNYRTN